MEGPLSRVKSLKKSLRQSFRRIRKSRVSGKKRAANANSKVSWGQAAQPRGVGVAAGRGAGRRRVRAWPLQLQEANAQLAEQAGPQDVEMAPVQRRIEPRSADDSLSGVVRCLHFADTFLRDGEARGTRCRDGPHWPPRNGPWGGTFQGAAKRF